MLHHRVVVALAAVVVHLQLVAVPFGISPVLAWQGCHPLTLTISDTCQLSTGPSRHVSSRTGSIVNARVDLERVVAAAVAKCDSLRQEGWRVSVAPHDPVSVAVHWLFFDRSQAMHSQSE